MDPSVNGPPLPDPSGHDATIAALCRSLLDRCVGSELSGAAVARANVGQVLDVLHSSEPTGGRLLQLQAVLGEGPAVTALVEATPMLVTDLAADPASRSWVGFSREAQAAGIGSYLAVPLQVGVIVLGVLGVHGTGPARLRPELISGLFATADRVALVLLEQLAAGLRAPSTGIPDRGRSAPDPAATDAPGATLFGPDTAVIHQATGMVMAQIGGTMDDALVALRAHAYGSGRTLTETARDIVQRRLSLDTDTPSTDRHEPGPHTKTRER